MDKNQKAAEKQQRQAKTKLIFRAQEMNKSLVDSFERTNLVDPVLILDRAGYKKTVVSISNLFAKDKELVRWLGIFLAALSDDIQFISVVSYSSKVVFPDYIKTEAQQDEFYNSLIAHYGSAEKSPYGAEVINSLIDDGVYSILLTNELITVGDTPKAMADAALHVDMIFESEPSMHKATFNGMHCCGRLLKEEMLKETSNPGSEFFNMSREDMLKQMVVQIAVKTGKPMLPAILLKAIKIVSGTSDEPAETAPAPHTYH